MLFDVNDSNEKYRRHEQSLLCLDDHFFDVIPFNLNIHTAASHKAPEEIPRAPFKPSLEIDKKTLTTRTLRGMPKMFMMTERCESGIYLLRSVPIEGKYMPTQASNTKKAATNPTRLMVDPTVKVALDIAMAAVASIEAEKTSVGTDIFAS